MNLVVRLLVSNTTFRKSAISFRKNIDCETFRNVAFLLVFPTANGECSTSCRQKVRFAMFSCYFLRIIIFQCFLVKCFSGVLKVQTKFGLQKHRWVWVAKILLNMADEWFLQPNSPKYCMYRLWQQMTCDQNRLIPSLELAFSFGKRWIPSREPINLPLQGATSETVTSESAKWKTLQTIRCQRVVWDCFCISLKTNRTPVTQELYLDEKTMPHVYVIVSRIYGSYTRSYILMRKQCLMFMLLLATSTAVTQGVISWWENNASCLCYC